MSMTVASSPVGSDGGDGLGMVGGGIVGVGIDATTAASESTGRDPDAATEVVAVRERERNATTSRVVPREGSRVTATARRSAARPPGSTSRAPGPQARPVISSPSAAIRGNSTATKPLVL
jgi:hypothetical protein